MAWEHAFSQHMFDLALSEEDVEELRSERSIKHTLVTSEEIEELSVDENLPPYERLMYMLHCGKDVQKVHAIKHMYNILQGESKENVEKALLLLKGVLVNAFKDVQLAGANFLLQVSEKRLINGEKFASHFSKDLLNNVKNKDPEICEGWISTFVGSLNIIPKRYINEVTSFLKTSGSLTQPINIRLLCCKLVAHVCKFVDKKRLVSEMIPVMRLLCQDIDLDVRACMCTQLPVLATFLEDDAVSEFILPELSLLLQDEETTVRLVALETLAKIIVIVRPVVGMTRLTAIVVTFYGKAVEKCIITELVGSAHFIGEIICCADFLSNEDKASLLTSYKCLCNQGIAGEGAEKNEINLDGCDSSTKDGSAECRYWCSYNFPAVVVSVTPEQVCDLIPIFLMLIKDPHPAVRKPLACSFHEISKRIIANNPDIVNEALIVFLSDRDTDILDGVLSGLASTFRLLFSCSSVQNYVANLMPNILECEQYLSQSLRWRVHKKFIENVFHLTEFLPFEDVYLKLHPIFFSILTGNKVIPVKLAAGNTLLQLTKLHRNIDERNEICATLETELAHSKSKSSRILYLDLCHYVSDLFSKSFFKDKFYSAAMELASDPVVNVRLKFCETLPLIKSQIRLPCDRLLLQTLEQTVRRIMAMENDRDVSNAIRQAITEMDSIRLCMDGTPPTEEDLADRRKEEEEENLLEEHNQRKAESKLIPRDRQKSVPYLDNHQTSSRRSLASDDSHDKLLGKGGVQRGSKSGSGCKLNAPKKLSKHSKDVQPGKLSQKRSSLKLQTKQK